MHPFLQRGSVFIDKEEQNRLLLAERMVEFYKDFDYYDYRDKTEIGDSTEEQIKSMAEDLKEHSSVMAAAAWLEVAVSEESMSEFQRYQARTILAGLKSLMTMDELVLYERDGHGSAMPIPEDSVWLPQLGEAVILDSRVYIVSNFANDVMLFSPATKTQFAEERYMPEAGLINLARGDNRNRWLFSEPPSQEFLKAKQEKIRQGIAALSPEQKRIVAAMELIGSYYDPERYDASDPITFRSGSITGRAAFWPDWDAVKDMLLSLPLNEQPGLRAEVRALLHSKNKEENKIDLNIRPMEEIEQSFCYTQEQDVLEKSGCIGHLRVDMGSDGLGFFTRWESHCDALPTDFSQKFDAVINRMRDGLNYDCPLADRGSLRDFCKCYPTAAFENGRDFGFRLDNENYTYMLRMNPNRGEYACYCYAYESDKLNRYLDSLQKMTVLVVEPEKVPYAKQIDRRLESLQNEVGGYIEAFYPFEDNAAIICNDEGKLNGLPLNRALYNDDRNMYDVVAGTFLVVGLDEENFASLTPAQLTRYEALYHTPESFVILDGEFKAVPIQRTADIPVYTETLSYAKKHGEKADYLTSFKTNVSCRDAIEEAIAQNYSNNHLSPDTAKQVIGEFGMERTMYVLANTVQVKDWDHRFSNANREWAKSIPVASEPDCFGGNRRYQFVVDQAHPGLTDLFLTQARREQAKEKSTRESVVDKLKRPAAEAVQTPHKKQKESVR